MKDYSLTKEQLKAVDEVKEAMIKAHKVGVSFWDDYGELTAFNAKKIRLPVPNSSVGNELNREFVKKLLLPNFFAGNADDPLYVVYR